MRYLSLKNLMILIWAMTPLLTSCIQSSAPVPPVPDDYTEGGPNGAQPGTPSSSPQPKVSPSPRASQPTPFSTATPYPSPSTIPDLINSECINADATICLIEKDIASRTNQYRASTGAKPLRFDAKLAAVARDWSKKQYMLRNISHAGFPSLRKMVYSQLFGTASFSFSGENVAMTSGSGLAGLAQEFATMWYNSSGHRRNMLDGSFNVIGVGIASASGNRGPYYATQIFGQE